MTPTTPLTMTPEQEARDRRAMDVTFGVAPVEVWLFHGIASRAFAEVDALRAEVVRLREDAARLEPLITLGRLSLELAALTKSTVIDDDAAFWEVVKRHTAAIDAARAAAKGEG